jgi:hypothetical protein
MNMKTIHAIIIGIAIILGLGLVGCQSPGRFQITSSQLSNGNVLVYVLDTETGRRWRRVDNGTDKQTVNGTAVWNWEETTPDNSPEGKANEHKFLPK